MDFLSESNPCGQSLLKLVARGNDIISEILRLSDFIPSVFTNPREQAVYKELLLDFQYFTEAESFEKRVSSSTRLLDLNEEFKENNQQIIERFYIVFESVYKYVVDVNKFVEDLEDGHFIQQNLESVIVTLEGKQLLAEAVYVYGVMMLLIDAKIPGDIREKMLVFFYRNGGTHIATDTNIDEVCKLLASTGYAGSFQKRPANYPENFLRRIKINEEFLQIIFGRLQNDDLYNLISFYPKPQHRSTALSSQASIVYILLFFLPDILHSQTARMREIVDRFFPDNWVINVYMVMTINLAIAWEPYKAARSALSHTLNLENVRALGEQHAEKLKLAKSSVASYLKEGVLTDNYLLDNGSKLLNCIRESNTTLRWLMVHTSKRASTIATLKQYKTVDETVRTSCAFNKQRVLELLMDSAQLEQKVKGMFKQLLRDKVQHWVKLRTECEERMLELSQVFSGTKPLTRVEKNDNLMGWFLEVKNQIASLNHEESTAAGRKILQLTQALEEVQEFHQLETNLHVKQFLGDTRQHLLQMLRIINIRQEYLSAIESIMDISYAWTIIDDYTSVMQALVKRDPTVAIKLKAVFLKLSSALHIPLIRLTQSKSPDRMSVSQYYSNELVMYMRKVLQIIPTTMFSILEQIVKIQTLEIKELPTKLERDKIGEFAQMDQRFEVARLTHDASVLTQGVLMMKNTLVGVIRIDPKQLLEDGIRKELVVQLADALHNTLVFNPKAKTSELSVKLTDLTHRIDGFRRSFEYIQDYVNLYGLKIWQEEYTRVLYYNVEQECNLFLRKKVSDKDSQFQSRTIPIPKKPPLDNESVTFVGRLGREILRVTDATTTTFVDQASTWYDARSKEPVMDPVLLINISDGIGTIGLALLDKFYSFMLVKRLQNAEAFIRKRILGDSSSTDQLAAFEKTTRAFSHVLDMPAKTYMSFINKMKEVLAPLGKVLLKVGQIQQIRLQLTNRLAYLCCCNSQYLYSNLITLNHAVLADIRAHYRDPTKPYPNEDPLLVDLASYLDHAGLGDPLQKVYIPTQRLKFIPALLSVLIVGELQKVTFVKSMANFVAKKDGIDGRPLVLGVHTFLRQFHSQLRHDVFGFLSQYVSSVVRALPNQPAKPADLSSDVTNILVFLHHLSLLSPDDNLIHSFLPAYLLEMPLY